MAIRFAPLALFVLCSFIAFAQSNTNGNDVVRSTNTDRSGITIETRVNIEKAGERAKITFLQETENGFIFKNVNWTGDVTLYLTNGAMIKLADTGMKGQSMQSGAYIAGYYVPNRYERYASYYLTPEECAMIRQSPVKRVEYKLDDSYDKNVQHLNLQDYDMLLKAQLTAIGM